MAKYNLSILEIQEHTPCWNRELFENEITLIHKHCDKYGYFATVSKLQIIVIDKQLFACHRETKIFEDGRIIKCRFEVSERQFVTFIPVYGVPHSSKKSEQYIPEINEENGEIRKLQTMLRVQQQLQSLLSTAIENSDFLYVFGDLQDTPDNSALFHYGSCRISKHPLGIVKTCEDLGLICSVYDHINTMEQPITSRHGSKGGRFIDGMYSLQAGLEKILGISTNHNRCQLDNVN
jgi:hypothetical protein